MIKARTIVAPRVAVAAVLVCGCAGAEIPAARQADDDRAPFAPVPPAALTRPAHQVEAFRGTYPRRLAEYGVEGTVVMTLEITKTGAVRNARVAHSSGRAELDEAATASVRRFRFAPAEVDGVPVDSLLRYTFRFSLIDSDRVPRLVAEDPDTGAVSRVAESTALDDVALTVQEAGPNVQSCYHAAARERPELAGTVMASWTVTANGRVHSASLDVGAIEPRHATFEACLLRVVRALRFCPPVDGRPVRVRYPFVFEPPGITATGGLRHEIVSRVVSARLPTELDRCRERAPVSRDVQTARARWTVSAGGVVGDVRLERSSIRDPALGDCIRKAIAALRFPVSDGEPTRVSAPIHLAASDEARPTR